MARLIPIRPATRPKTLGLLEGQIVVPDDFNAPLPDSVIAQFDGR